MKYRVFRTLPLFVVLSAVAFAQDLASFEKRITVKKLNNGLTVVICERPEAPVFAFFTHVDAGSVQDPLGETGMAHMFEHMAFKGTDKIGTTDYAAEKVALQKVEQAYAAYLAERDKRVDRDDQKLKEWEKAWQAAIAEAQRYVKPNEFPQILESNGAEGLNAFTNEDETAYHYSLPENRLELWAYLESERFIHPVMREFYKERNVVNSERRVVLREATQPLYLEGYHRPDYLSKDDAVYDAIADLMSNGRTSRLYRALVRDKKIAADSAGFTGLPGIKYPHLFAFYAFPMPGHKPEEVAEAIHAEIERLKAQDISDDELKMIKTRAKANLIRGLANDEGLAFQLAIYQARYDDWRELFRSVDRIDKVTKADIRRVATQTFLPANRTVGIIETTPPATQAQSGGEQ